MQSNLVIFIVLCVLLIGLLAFVGTKYLNKEKARDLKITLIQNNGSR